MANFASGYGGTLTTTVLALVTLLWALDTEADRPIGIGENLHIFTIKCQTFDVENGQGQGKKPVFAPLVEKCSNLYSRFLSESYIPGNIRLCKEKIRTQRKTEVITIDKIC